MITQIILTIIFYLWLFTVVILLWRHAIGAGARARKIDVLLAESTKQSAEAAHKAAEAVWKIADMMEQQQHDHQ